MKSILKTTLLSLLAVFALCAAASASPIEDTIEGVEVFDDAVPNWQARYKWTSAAAGEYGIYLTREAYEGEAAMLVRTPASKDGIDPVNKGLTKKAAGAEEYMVEGDKYKMVFYVKPLGYDAAKEKYKLHASIMRYYDDYTVYNLTRLENAETGEEYTAANGIYYLDESVWCRAEIEFPCVANKTLNSSYGMAFWARYGYSMIVDSITLYHQTGNTWEAVPEPYGVNNGSFEQGVQALHGVTPKNITVQNLAESVTLQWESTVNQTTVIYNQETGEELASVEPGVTTATISGLTGDKIYIFSLVGQGAESSAEPVSAKAMPFTKDGYVTEGDTMAPGPVLNFTVKPDDTVLQLSWTRPGDRDVAGFKVFCGGEEAADLSRTETDYTITGLVNDAEYTVSVVAYDLCGNESEPAEIMAVPTLPEVRVNSIELVQGSVAAGTNTVRASITNNKVSGGVPAVLVLCVYDSQGRVLTNAAASAETTAQQGQTIELTADVTAEKGSIIKAFLWKGIDSITAIQKHVEFQ